MCGAVVWGGGAESLSGVLYAFVLGLARVDNKKMLQDEAAVRVFLGLGANLGDRRAHLVMAGNRLGKVRETRLLAMGPVIETAPVGPVEQGAYLNTAAKIETKLAPMELLAALQEIERDAGRTEKSQRTRWGPRELDIDILLYGDQVISTDELVVPHPLMHERLFVLEPLATIGSDAVHPILEMTVGMLLKHARDGGR